VSTGGAFAGAAGTDFCFAMRGLARLAADTWIGGKTVVEDGCDCVAEDGGGAAPGALPAIAVCARASLGQKSENRIATAANRRDVMNSPRPHAS